MPDVVRSVDTRGRLILRVLLALFFGIGGVVHLMAPGKFLAITPDWVPAAYDVIIVTGILEIAGSIALLSRTSLRYWAGIGLALYALCVWPANFKHALEGVALPPIPDTWWYHAPRLALQPVIIWAALYAGGAIDWPFLGGSRRRGA